MKTRICAALVVMLGVGTAGAQLVASHSSTAPAQKSTPAAALPSSAQPMTSGGTMALSPSMQVTGKAVARVNGAELTDADLLREMRTLFPYAQQHNGFPKDLEPEIRRGALQMIIFEELVYQEAKRRNLSIPPAQIAAAEKEFRKQFRTQTQYQDFLKQETNGSEAAMRDKIRRALLIESMLNLEVNNPARVTTAELRARYQKNLAAYKHGEVIQIQSISIIPPNQSKAVLQEAKTHAADAAKKAKQAKSYREFGLLAEQLSDDDFHVKMGDHKPQDASALPPAIVEAAAKMKPGEVSDLIQLGDYYTIFRLESRVPAGVTPFAEVKPKLQSDMQKEKTEQLRSALDQKLRKNAKIETL